MNETKYLIFSDYVTGICTIIPISSINLTNDLDFDYEEYLIRNKDLSINYEWFIGTLDFK